MVGGRLRVQKVLRKTQDVYVRTGFRYRNYSKDFEHLGKSYIPLAEQLQKSKSLLGIPYILHERRHGLAFRMFAAVNCCTAVLLDANVRKCKNVFVAFAGFV